ncbi:MAG: helix-turn-helix domain-containing protein [Actinomycetota bacterium]|nr:helix-turn-helix domain-containing protein [Actinomycetota bacterium]
MESRCLRTVTDEGLPDLLTVEEAAEILRIGRTKAYDLARRWRSTNGASGLPVLDFGNVLRVPCHALERMIGAELHAVGAIRIVESSEPADEQLYPSSETAPTTRRQRPLRRPRPPAASQLDLFDSFPSS